MSDQKLSRVNKNNRDSKEVIEIDKGKVKKQFSNLQKGIAFVGSILSVIVASITITNNLSKPKTNTVKESTPSTVKVIHSTESVPETKSSATNTETKSSDTETGTEEKIKE